MSRITRTGSALLAGATVATLALSPLLSPLASAAPATKPDAGATTDGADWLTSQLTGGLIHNSSYDFDDYGLSIDAALGLAAVGGHKPEVKVIARAVAKNVASYTGAPDVYAGSVAKSLVLAQVSGQNPTSYGGVNLVSTLEGRVSTAAPIAGRITDSSAFGDYANTIGQAYAVRGLTAADSKLADEASAFLLSQQCRSGSFRLYFNADKTAPKQGCAEGKAGSEPDTDATALAVINLLAGGEPTKAEQKAVAKAADWLVETQANNGSFGGGSSTETANSNSTGLAGWALALSGDTEAAAKAAAWVRKQQPVDIGVCGSELTAETGAIGYDAKAVKAGRTDGLAGDAEDQWRRATAQALPVLQWAPDGIGRLALAAPAKELKGGREFKVTVSGLAKGQQACVWVHGSMARVVGKGKTVGATLTVPSGVKAAKVKIRTLDAKASTSISVRN